MKNAAWIAVFLLTAVAVSAIVATPAKAAQRVVLVEDFTNDQCPPCDAIQDTMDVILQSYVAAGKIAPIRYHVWWPHSQDPMYLWPPATADVQARVSYYAVNGVPTFEEDGRPSDNYLNSPNLIAFYARMRTVLDSLYANPAQVRFENFTQQNLGAQVNVSFDVVVDNTTGLGTSQSLYLAVTELTQQYGTVTERYIFRNLVPSSTGEPLALSTVGETVHFDWSYATHDLADPNKAVTVLFMQRGNGKVLQALYAPVSNPTDVAGLDPLRFRLEQNVPNPFNPVTAIPFQTKEAGNVRLSVFDVTGRLVTDLVNGYRPGGTYEAIWRGSDASGNPVASGVYYYRLDSGAASETRKMVMVR